MQVCAIIAVFGPLLGALLAGLGSRWLNDKGAQVVTCALMGVASFASLFLFESVAIQGETHNFPVLSWISVGEFKINWGFHLDTLSVVMMSVVTLVSTAVHVYSVGYMSHDKSIPRFMSYLSLFTFFMLALVTAPNLLQMFFGWEGVGLASYLLIGFWYDKPAANAAAIKAFLVNRVGDVGFALGILTVFFVFGSVEFKVFLYQSPEYNESTYTFLGGHFDALSLAALLLFIGAMGKSAQLGLHTWLPDAMEGPTPVSALIHAATMVTAGVFMVARLSPMLEYTPVVRDIITIIGAATALFAATVACTQFDIKRVIAYSTCSQLGYMFMAAGMSAYSASIFHLTTHAFFKALLFLGAGSVIHALSDEQDLRRMGGLWSLIPITYVLMWIGNLALAGIPLFAGYYSKDIVLESLWASGNVVGQWGFVVGVAVAALTAFYSWRLLILTFHGRPRADDMVMSHVHESPKVMLLPLVFLAVGSILSGALLYTWFVGDMLSEFWGASIFVLPENNSIEAAHHVKAWVKITPLLAALLGIGLAYFMYMFMKVLPVLISRGLGPLYRFIHNKWYVDELYDVCFVHPCHVLANILWKKGDKAVIDDLGPNGISALSLNVGKTFCRLQSGYIYHYAFAMIVGVTVFIGWFLY